MRSIQVKAPGGLENLMLVKAPDVEPQDGEVLVRWRATSLNYHDYLVANGTIPVKDGLVPMSDGAGEIIALGPGVKKWQIGDHVMSLFFQDWIDGAVSQKKMAPLSGERVNGYAIEKSCLNENSLTRIPKGYSFAQAATLPCAALTAWRALIVEGRLRKGETVLVEGSGGMSVFALQIANALGAVVYATTSSDEKADRLKQLGADHVVNYRQDEKWGKTIYDLSGDGVDHVLDVGGEATLRQSIAAAKVGGDIALIGILGGPKTEILLPMLFFKQLRLNGIAVGSADMQLEMVRAFEKHAIEPVIDRSFALEDLVDAFEYLSSGNHFGKIVVDY